MVSILAVETAVPLDSFSQVDFREFAGKHFKSWPDISRLLSVFENVHVERRFFAAPREWFLQPRTFAERNAQYVKVAIELGEQVVSRCLNAAGLEPHDLDHLIFVSSTGFSTPSIDAHL